MTEQDRYYSFLIDAISAPNQNSEFVYLYSPAEHQLVQVRSELLVQKRNQLKGMHQLPKLDYCDKVNWLKDYLDKKEGIVRETILEELESFTESSLMYLQFPQALKNVNHNAAVQMNLDLGKFLVETALQKYKGWSLDESAEVKILSA